MHEIANTLFVASFFAVYSAIVLALLHQLVGRRILVLLRNLFSRI